MLEASDLLAKPNSRIVVGISGASGSILAERLILNLLPKVERIYIIASDLAIKIALYELTEKTSLLRNILKGKNYRCPENKIRVFHKENLFAPIASGSQIPEKMIVVPCSMGALARIRHGISSNLLERTADVFLKQRKQLILCPRETPLSVIHLENMLDLAKMNVAIIPATPGYYHRPQKLDDLTNFVVGKLLEALNFDHNLYEKWNLEQL